METALHGLSAKAEALVISVSVEEVTIVIVLYMVDCDMYTTLQVFCSQDVSTGMLLN